MDPNQHHNALNRHDMLHWYEIQSILGQGGFGITYLAKDVNLDQLVAIKEYLPSEFSTRDKENTVQPISENHTEIFDWGKKRFLDEAKTLAQFRHPNVVRVNSFFENNNTGYMVMEYEEGTELAAMIKAGEAFDEQRLLELLLPILDGLEQIHAQGFIHRDIKPANVFIRNDGSPVLIDFGSARQAIGGQTKTMTSLVTPGFAPFEQYHDAEGKQGPWTDIYALGATCYSMITGKPPIDALKRGMARLDHSTDAYLHLSDLNIGKYSRNLLLAIDHALEFKETDRPQTVAEWRAMLLGETAVPQSDIATQVGAIPPADDAGDTRVESTRVVTREDDRAPAPQADAAAKAEPAPPPQADSAPPRKGRNRVIAITAGSIIVVLIAVILVRGQQSLEPAQPETETAGSETSGEPRTAAPSQAETASEPQTSAPSEQAPENAQQREQARLEAEREALRKEQARIAAEKEKLRQEQARIEAEKQRQAELAQQKLDEKRQAELARKQAAEQKRQQELARQAAEKERQQALAKQKAEKERLAALAKSNQASAAAVRDFSGTYSPAVGFEEVVLKQKGNKVKGSIGVNQSTLEGVIVGDRLEFSFRYSRTGYGYREGTGVLTLSADGARLSGYRSGGGFPPNSHWSLTRQGVATQTTRSSSGSSQTATGGAATNLFADLSGVYEPDEGFEELQLVQEGNKVTGTIGTNGSTLEGTRKGNKVTFVFNYSRTGYGFRDGYGQFIVSADGKRLTGIRNKAGFPNNSNWNLSRK